MRLKKVPKFIGPKNIKKLINPKKEKNAIAYIIKKFSF